MRLVMCRALLLCFATGLVSVWATLGGSFAASIDGNNQGMLRAQHTPKLGSTTQAAGLPSVMRALMHAADASDLADRTVKLVGRLDFVEAADLAPSFRFVSNEFPPPRYNGLNINALSTSATKATPQELDVFGFRYATWEHGETLAINRSGGTRNCSRCATALDSTWNGTLQRARTLFDAYDLRDARRYLKSRPGVVRRIAQSLGYKSLVEDPSKITRTNRERVIRIAVTHFAEITDDEAIAARLGFDASDFEYVSYRDLRALLRTWPNGAKGVLTLDRSGVGHAMNVIRHRGQTFIIDAQSNLQVRSFKADNIAVLRTDDVPRNVDLDAMGLTSPFDPH